jgi:hypothetical protein
MAYTLGEAARATGKSKPAISKAIKSGRLSASRADDGSYRIDPAELERVYPVTGSLNGQGRRDETPVDTGELTLWRTLATERESTIRDLRARLDASENDRRQIEAERRQLSERLHGLLTDRTGKGTETSSFPPVEPNLFLGETSVAPPTPGEPHLLNKSTSSVSTSKTKAFPEETVSAPPDSHSELTQSTGTSASSGLAIPRPRWWRRWVR